jgi:hypothetical protein
MKLPRGSRDASRRKSGHLKVNALDAVAYEAIERFARVMVRCKFSNKALAEAFGLALASAQGEVANLPKPTIRYLPEAPHVVTLWCTSSDYVDEHGVPVALPARGPQRSLEVLVRRVDRALDLEDVIRYLLRTGTVRRVGSRYVLGRRWIAVRGVSGSLHSHSIRRLVGVLRTLEHNLLAEADTDSWFEFTAENPRFPVSQLDAFNGLARRTGIGWLRKLDLFMQQCETQRDPTEPTVWLGVGMHRYQLDSVDTKSANRPRTFVTRRSRTRRRRA